MALAHALIHRRRRDWLPAVAVAVVVVVLGLVSQPSDKTATEEVSVACVQAETFNHHDYVQLTTQAVEHPSKPKFVVLPEHTILDYADENHHLVKSLAGLARDHGVYICVGVHTRAPEDAECDYDNVALLIGPSGSIIGRQAKAVPLPFFVDGNPAESQEVIDTDVGPVGMYICYDGNFTDITRRLVKLGAGLLLVPVMNPEGWPAQQRWQQANIARFRSIESRRWSVRAASSGVSQIVDSDGRIRQQRSRDEGPGILYGTVHVNDERTAFSQGGHLFALVVGVVYLIVVAWLTVVDWRRRFSAR